MAEAFGGNRSRIIGPIVPEATFRRAQKAWKLSRKHSERLYEVGRVVIAVAQAYRGALVRIEAFMTRPHPLLDEEPPFDMARSSSAGADAVLNLVQRAERGRLTQTSPRPPDFADAAGLQDLRSARTVPCLEPGELQADGTGRVSL